MLVLERKELPLFLKPEHLFQMKLGLKLYETEMDAHDHFLEHVAWKEYQGRVVKEIMTEIGHERAHKSAAHA